MQWRPDREQSRSAAAKSVNSPPTKEQNMANDLKKARIFSNLERWVRESDEFASEYPHLADFEDGIRAAYLSHCHRGIEGRRVSIREAYEHVKNCKQCQDYVDVGRVGLNQYLKVPIPPLEFN